MLKPRSLCVLRYLEETTAELLNQLPNEPNTNAHVFMFCDLLWFPISASLMNWQGLVHWFGLLLFCHRSEGITVSLYPTLLVAEVPVLISKFIYMT